MYETNQSNRPEFIPFFEQIRWPGPTLSARGQNKSDIIQSLTNSLEIIKYIWQNQMTGNWEKNIYTDDGDSGVIKQGHKKKLWVSFKNIEER